MKPKLSTRQYYDLVPSLEHQTGDIWKGLPTFELLKSHLCSGIVITPACDLSNRKVGTITYLPIIPIRQFIGTTGMFGEVRGTLKSALNSLGLSSTDSSMLDGWRPSLDELRTIRPKMTELLERQKQGTKEFKRFESLIERCNSGLNILETMFDCTKSDIDPTVAQVFFGEREWDTIKTKMITNSFRADIHFLPCDEQETDFSGICEHSVVLFRYPLTAPIEIFDHANDVLVGDWPKAMEGLSKSTSFAKTFFSSKPLKVATLRAPFRNDLLSRFLALYLRLGSPDFTDATVAALAAEIRGPQ